MERDDRHIYWQLFGVYFNSHAHVERDPEEVEMPEMWYISTHTLTWSVTTEEEPTEEAPTISTHTLTWSVT